MITLGAIEPTPNRTPSSLKSNERDRSLGIPRLTSPVHHADGITFAVDDVVPAPGPLWVGSLGESAEIRSDASILIMPDRDISSIAPEGYCKIAAPGEPRKPLRTAMRRLSVASPVSVARQLARMRTFLHPLVQAVHTAFSDHRPLVLTPDSIWLTIMQGFGHHVNQNAESLRDRIVRHQGKKQLCIEIQSLDPACWPAFISEFSGLIKENSDPMLYETLLCEFSTTTPTIKTACEIALMDTYQRYFDYGMRCVCGIPSITLEGMVEDWQRIRDRIEVLATYDLDWWTSRVVPILDQLVATAKGDPDREFWQAIYKPQKAYAADQASGWIADLFPYLFIAPPAQLGQRPRGLCDSPKCDRNHVLRAPRKSWLLPAPSHPMAGAGVNLEHFPSGISRALIKVELQDGSKFEVEVIGGFLGTSQRAQDHALSPIISWAVVKKGMTSLA
jgi:Domain of unknown function (DUF4419)